MSTPQGLLPFLRRETRDVHQALEQTHYSRRLMRGDLPRPWLRGFVQAEAHLLGTTLELQRSSPQTTIQRLDSGLEERHRRTLRDMEGLAPGEPPGALRRLLAAQEEALRLEAQADPWRLLGVIYVIAGSALGGLQIARVLRESFPEDRHLLTRFEAPQRVAQGWRALSAQLNHLGEAPQVKEAALLGARAGFGAYQSLLDLLADMNPSGQ